MVYKKICFFFTVRALQMGLVCTKKALQMSLHFRHILLCEFHEHGFLLVIKPPIEIGVLGVGRRPFSDHNSSPPLQPQDVDLYIAQN